MTSAISPTTLSPAPTGHSHARESVSEARSETNGQPSSKTSESSEANQQRLSELRARDREVRAHEQAHLSAAGGFAKGGATYTLERGSDSRMYAVGGEVQIDTSKVADDPVATLRKAQVIRRAALAPANPSSQDRSVAAEATRMATEAQSDLSAKRQAESSQDASSQQNATEDRSLAETAASCPACGGAHSVDAHSGMTAYAENMPSPSSCNNANAAPRPR